MESLDQRPATRTLHQAPDQNTHLEYLTIGAHILAGLELCKMDRGLFHELSVILSAGLQNFETWEVPPPEIDFCFVKRKTCSS